MSMASYNRMGTICVLAILGVACFSQESTPPPDAQRSVHVAFPELRPVGELPGSMEWTFQDGPDFYVYYAASTENELLSLGFYFGHFPSPHHPEFTQSLPGEVAGSAVTWSMGQVESDGAKLFLREAMFEYPPHARIGRVSNPLQIHVWASADSEAGMNSLVQAIRELSFEVLNSPNDHLNRDHLKTNVQSSAGTDRWHRADG